MTNEQQNALESRGWIVTAPDHWRSPLTHRDFTEREVLTLLALPSYRDRRRGHQPFCHFKR